MNEIFPISFTYHGVRYEGCISPAEMLPGSAAGSYQVVLNNVYFGSMKKDNRTWIVNERRPPELAELVGFCIDNHFKQLQPL
jgi:hypothetical protein